MVVGAGEVDPVDVCPVADPELSSPVVLFVLVVVELVPVDVAAALAPGCSRATMTPTATVAPVAATTVPRVSQRRRVWVSRRLSRRWECFECCIVAFGSSNRIGYASHTSNGISRFL